MNVDKYQYISIFVPLILILALFLWRRYSSTSTHPHSANCADGSVSIDPASEQAGKILEAALVKDKGTGISAAVVVDGEVVFARAVGQADPKSILGSHAQTIVFGRLRINAPGAITRTFILPEDL